MDPETSTSGPLPVNTPEAGREGILPDDWLPENQIQTYKASEFNPEAFFIKNLKIAAKLRNIMILHPLYGQIYFISIWY